MTPSECATIIAHMSEDVRARFRDALEVAVATMRNVADGCDRGYRTIIAYRDGERRVTTEAVDNFVAYLRRRAEQLTRAADALEAAKEEGDDG